MLTIGAGRTTGWTVLISSRRRSVDTTMHEIESPKREGAEGYQVFWKVSHGR